MAELDRPWARPQARSAHRRDDPSPASVGGGDGGGDRRARRPAPGALLVVVATAPAAARDRGAVGLVAAVARQRQVDRSEGDRPALAGCRNTDSRQASEG